MSKTLKQPSFSSFYGQQITSNKITHLSTLTTHLKCGIFHIQCFFSCDLDHSDVNVLALKQQGITMIFSNAQSYLLKNGQKQLLESSPPREIFTSNVSGPHQALTPSTKTNSMMQDDISMLDVRIRLNHCVAAAIQRTFHLHTPPIINCKQCAEANPKHGSLVKTNNYHRIHADDNILYVDYKAFNENFLTLIVVLNEWMQRLYQKDKHESTDNLIAFIKFFRQTFTISLILNDNDAPI